MNPLSWRTSVLRDVYHWHVSCLPPSAGAAATMICREITRTKRSGENNNNSNGNGTLARTRSLAQDGKRFLGEDRRPVVDLFQETSVRPSIRLPVCLCVGNRPHRIEQREGEERERGVDHQAKPRAAWRASAKRRHHDVVGVRCVRGHAMAAKAKPQPPPP